VKPCGRPERSVVVTTATPVGKSAMKFLND
jgi:hypothetical protein